MKTITDRLIDPYQIETDSLQYTVVRPYEGNTKEGDTYEGKEVVGYYSTLGNALQHIAVLKTKAGSKRVTIQQFINEYKKQPNLIRGIIDE